MPLANKEKVRLALGETRDGREFVTYSNYLEYDAPDADMGFSRRMGKRHQGEILERHEHNRKP